MGKVVGIGDNRFSAGRAAGSAPALGRWSERSQSGGATEGVPQPGSEPKGGRPNAVFGLGPLAALAAAAAAETNIAKLLRNAAETAAGALSLRHVLILAPDCPDDTMPTYAGVGWSAKQQRRVVCRLEKKAAGSTLPNRVVPNRARSNHTQAYTFFESGLLKKRGGECCLVTIGGSGPSRVVILADCRGLPDAKTAQVTEFFCALAGVLGLGLARFSKHREISRVDAQVRRAKIHWEDAVDVLHQLVCVLDYSGRVIRVNRTLEDWGLGSVKSAPGRTIHELLHPQCGDPKCALRQACSTAWQEVGDLGLSRFEVGDPLLGRELLVGFVPNRKEHVDLEPGSSGFVIIEDVTKRKIADQMLEHFNQELQRRVEQKTNELIRSERELRDLSSQLMTAQEEERQRIAGELHDGIGQQLSVIKFGVERVLEEASGTIPPDQEYELGAIVARVRETIEEVRRVSMDLRPSILDDLGLVSTIDWFCREHQQMESKLAIHKNVKIQEGDIPAQLKVAIFRILQEACNNISKYARATLVSVKLTKHEDKIRFSVSDDGIGFDYERLARLGKGFGLGSMKQRAMLTGGVCRMSSARGLGTRIDVEWPLDRESVPD